MGGTLTGSDKVYKDKEYTYKVEGVYGTPPFTYLTTTTGQLTFGSLTDTIGVKHLGCPLVIETVVSNACGSVTLIKQVSLTPARTYTVPIDWDCKHLVSLSGKILGKTESNRVIEFNNTSVTFLAEIGVYDYEFVGSDIANKTYYYYLKNIEG
jgi:hypothetical protein